MDRRDNMRRNIFEILSEDFDVEREIYIIFQLFKNTFISVTNNPLQANTMHLLDFVDLYSFKKWKARNRCVSTQDMMERLGINFDSSFIGFAELTTEILIYLEFIVNMIKRYDTVRIEGAVAVRGNYELLKENINILLENFGYTTYYYEDEQKVVIIEKDPATISVAEISEPETAKKIIQYNHYTLKGKIDEKKDIIIALASELEPQRREIEQINSQLETHLFFMFNNMNLRHNNKDLNDKKQYKPFVAKMNDHELEQWYDETYQMILLAKLLLDNKERQDRIIDLKKNF